MARALEPLRSGNWSYDIPEAPVLDDGWGAEEKKERDREGGGERGVINRLSAVHGVRLLAG
jgi:hypothetical protein